MGDGPMRQRWFLTEDALHSRRSTLTKSGQVKHLIDGYPHLTVIEMEDILNYSLW